MADADPIRPSAGPLRTFERIRQSSVEAVLSESGLNHPALAREIRRRFGGTHVEEGALVREPVIEGAARFVTSGKTFADCAGDPLHPAVIQAISSDQAGDYRFPPDAQPYRHQLAAWRQLSASEPQSVLVSSGTGSGKTECFLMPLLSDLADEAERVGKLSGVRAIALYPLNALIASQEERLRAWTAPFGDRVRFGLYNGLTPEKPLRAEDRRPEQVRDRATLRSDPPPILVTNVTMLEYMIVRRVDRPLIENSRGKLRWIILDEAHSYVGSSAAEIALLIRRVLLTFGVRAEDVRFVATSATIGEGRDVTDELRRFLRDLSGAEESRVHVVLGEREKVLLPEPAKTPILTPADLATRDRVAASPAVQAFVRAAEQAPVSLDRASALLAPTGLPLHQAIDGITDASDKQRGPLLPLRIHGFLRAIPGLWSCLNPDCTDSPDGWAFGAVHTERVDQCDCGSPVLEVKLCRECGEPYLEGEELNGQLRAVTTPPTADEFAVLAEREMADEESDEAAGADLSAAEADYAARTVLLATRRLPEGRRPAHVEVTSGRWLDAAGETSRELDWHYPEACGACGAEAGAAGPLLRPFRFGAPFLIGNVAPVLLEGVPARTALVGSAYRPPADGRQLLSFTDSRQGTARFAANLQTNAERGFVRSFLYHATQGSVAAAAGSDSQAEALRTEIAALEAANVAALADLLATKKAALAELSLPSLRGLSWPDLRQGLAATPEVSHWMERIWSERDDRYKSPHAFAEFLMLRELARRPRRANTLETMGLVRLRFDVIDRASAVPEPLHARGFDADAWRALLYNVIDMVVRSNFAIRAIWDDAHWLHARTPLGILLAPGEPKGGGREKSWPMLGNKTGLGSNLIIVLEKALGLDRSQVQDRAQINALLEAMWLALSPLFQSPMHSDRALDLSKAHIAPVADAWQCPVTRRMLPNLALGLTPYGHREGLRTANESPQPVHFPRLPVSFPRGDEIEGVRRWLQEDAAISSLRDAGIWGNLHDRIALRSPYIRSAEHSAQQPPDRLRRFEAEFKRGEINILNCSTTMEMGVDIGSVSAVMMTNVPPALANYRQRVGRAGRRGQGFAASLTYTRDTPLDREAYRDPEAYLARATRAPRVKLDSRRIVQRHVNALLLARWFATAGGEALKTKVGDFFGLPADLEAAPIAEAPADLCGAWLTAPSTIDALAEDMKALVRGTILAGDTQLFLGAQQALATARAAIREEWEIIRAQATDAPKEGRDSLRIQMRRLVDDNLLKELGYRGVLPGHGFPTGVVPFINADKLNRGESPRDDADDSSQRRRSFPTRTLDIAIRDYAPGAEVVIDGLVYQSAGVTLNWLRPADDVEAKELQSIKTYWMCPSCGAADVGHAPPIACPACKTELPSEGQRRFLAPAGFTADMAEKPHADTDRVLYVEPEAEQIVARGSLWSSMADPAQGRMRASHDGLVFYSSRGPAPKIGYSVCLECGRAAAVSQGPEHPLKDHAPLRFTKRGADGRCPGNDKPFKITLPLALGHETITDVVELQPVGLETAGTAWAAVSAFREALARALGIETSELGMAVRPAATPLGQRTFSLFLYDRASGGAGFAPQAVPLFEALLRDAAKILDCNQPGCVRGCSACVLTADMFRHAETIDRQGALVWAKKALVRLSDVPADDLAAPDAVLERSVADALADAAERGASSVTIWIGGESDLAAIGHGKIAALARSLADRGVGCTLILAPEWLKGLDPAARRALRDVAIRFQLTLRQGLPPGFHNGAYAIAAAEQAGSGGVTLWASRDPDAAVAGSHWGEGHVAPVVRFAVDRPPLTPQVNLDSLLPRPGAHFLEVRDELNGPIVDFGRKLRDLLVPAIRMAGGDKPLVAMTYSDRYLQSPLVVRLMAEALGGLRDGLGGGGGLPVAILTNRLRPNERQPFAPDHDWQWEEDREAVLLSLLEERGFVPTLTDTGAAHGRFLTLQFNGGGTVRVVLDQGFGPWRTPSFARWNHFGDPADVQATKISSYSAIVEARGPTYVLVTE